MTHTLTIPNWHPARLNQWDGKHWAVRARMKRADRELVALFARQAGIPRATGKRRLSLTLTLGPRQRAADPDAYFKSLLDSLVYAGLLVDDNRQGVELGAVEFDRGPAPATQIVLEELASAAGRTVAGTGRAAHQGGAAARHGLIRGRDAGLPSKGGRGW
jgi:hypothetical protein